MFPGEGRTEEAGSRREKLAWSEAVSGHLSQVLSTLDYENLDEVQDETTSVCEAFGLDGFAVAIGELITRVGTRDIDTASPACQLLEQMVQRLLPTESCGAVIAQGILQSPHNSEGAALDELCSKAVRLAISGEIRLLLALLESECYSDLREQAKMRLKDRIGDLAGSLESIPEDADLLQRLLLFLVANREEFDSQFKLLSDAVREYYESRSCPFHLRTLLSSGRSDGISIKGMLKENINSVTLEAELFSSLRHAKVIEEVGYACTASAECFRALLDTMPPLDEEAVAEILSMMARTYTGLDQSPENLLALTRALAARPVPEPAASTTWNVDVVEEVLIERAAHLSISSAMMKLDQPEFNIPDQTSFTLLMQMYKRLTSDPFPIEAVCGDLWGNTAGQMSFLSHAVFVPPEVFTFKHTPRKQAPVEGLNANKSPTGTINECWLSLDLLSTLFDLAEVGFYSKVRSILDHPMKQCPEILLVGAAQAKKEWHSFQAEIISALIPSYVSNHPNSSVVLSRLWQVRQDVVLQGLVDLYFRDRSNITRVLDVCQELKELTTVLNSTPHYFAIDLAALASRREYLNIEKWLGDQLSKRRPDFVRSCLEFLSDVCSEQQREKRATVSVSEETQALFIKVLQHHANALGSDLSSEIHKVSNMLTEHNPRLQRLLAESRTYGPQTFTKEVEDEANSHFQRLYSNEVSAEELANLLKSYRSSGGPHEKQVMACIVRNLLDEYRFLPRYPERELRLTGGLFGAIIRHGLLEPLTLGLALRLILDALRKDPNNHMYVFGCEALEQFRSRALEWQQFCEQLVENQHLHRTHPDLIARIEQIHGLGPSGPRENVSSESEMTSSHAAAAAAAAAAMVAPQNNQQESRQLPAQPESQSELLSFAHDQSQQIDREEGDTTVGESEHVQPKQQHYSSGVEPRDSQRTPYHESVYVPRSTAKSPSTSFTGQMTPETMQNAAENAYIQEPEQTVIDRVGFVMNNLTDANIDQKAKDIDAILREEHYEWFANYVVTRRAAMEANLHGNYLALIEKLGNARLQRLLLQATYRNVKVLIKSEKCKHSSGERSILKNLGSWLGQLTIAKQRPVLQKDLDLKQLLIEAFETGRLIAVLPFVTRVLEPAKNSKVFGPPNPWVMAILSLLVEIYYFPDLKLNNKFEIERLFKQVDVNLQDVSPAMVLDRDNMDLEDNNDFAKDKKQNLAPTQARQGTGAVPSADREPFGPQSRGNVPSAAAAFQRQGPGMQGMPPEVAPMPSQRAKQPAHSSLLPSGSAIPSGRVPLIDYTPPKTKLQVTHRDLVTVNPNLAVLGERLNLRQIIEQSIGQAVNEAYPPILERSVKIACNTTRFLVMKDFALEPDENRMKKAAVHMASHLAGGLALVTVRESMKQHLSNKLREIMTNEDTSGLDQNVIEQAMHLMAADNADLCCAMVEQAAVDRARREVEDLLKPALEARKQTRESAPAQPFYDTAQLPPNVLTKLPEMLRPNVTHFNPKQQQIYDAFEVQPQLMMKLQEEKQKSEGMRASSTGSQVSSAMQQQPMAQQQAHQPTTGAQVMASRQMAAKGKEKVSAGLEGMPGNQQALAPFGGSAQSGGMESPHGDDLQQLLEIYNVCVQRVEAAAVREPHVAFESLPPEHEAKVAVSELSESMRKSNKPDEAALAIAHKAFTRACESNGYPLHVTSLIAIIAASAEATRRFNVQREVTNWLIHSDEQNKYKQALVESLLRRKLLVVAEFDKHLAMQMTSSRGAQAAKFAAWLLQRCVVEERLIRGNEVPNTVEVLRKIAQRSGTQESTILSLVESAKADVEGSAPGRKPAQQTPQAVQEQVAKLFDEWVRLMDLPAGDTSYISFFAQIQAAGVLLPEENQEQFFRVMAEIAIAHCQNSDARLHSSGGASLTTIPPPSLNFTATDAYVSLILTLARFLPEAANSQRSTSFQARLGILTRGVNAVTTTLLRHADERIDSFNPRPYLRLFSGLLVELNAPDSNLNLGQPEVLAVMANALLIIQPQRLPPMAVAWLELISHRCLLPRLLLDHNGRGWPMLQKLLISLLKFMEPHLREAKLTESMRLLYKGTLRVMLVILHDVPEFFVDYHTSFCDVLPPTCIQLRNLVLSAYPTNMKLVDPFTPNLKVDLLPQSSQPPRISKDADAEVYRHSIKEDIDTYLSRGQPANIGEKIRNATQLPMQDAYAAGTMYNVPLINASVLYVATHAIQARTQEMKSPVPVRGTPGVDIFMAMVVSFDEEGRYHVLNAIANQLRYPNNHTHFFSCLLLFLFAETRHEHVREQITRVLLERLIANRPHPWGLLITFIELIQNRKYDIWKEPFVYCAPEIRNLFEHCAKYCVPAGSGNARPS